jgi:ABC transport system ATP-binding/permease protein
MSSGSLYKLIVSRGPVPGQVFELNRAALIIGRDPASEIVIDGSGVSRRHAQLTVEAGGVVIIDLGSSNGTYVNGQRIQGPHRLAAGDTLGLGHSIELSFDGPPLLGQSPATVLEPKRPQPQAASPEPQRPPGQPGTQVPAPQQPLAAQPRVADRPAGHHPPASDQPPATVLGDVDLRGMSQILGTGLGTRDGGRVAPPPVLTIEEAGQPGRSIELVRDHYGLGRSDENEIRIASPIVSRRHLRLERTGSGYRLVPVPEAANPVLFEGRPLQGARQLEHGDMLRIGSQDPGTMVTLRYAEPAMAGRQPPAATPIRFGEKPVLQIGRDHSNDIRLDTPQISRFHAQVERVGQRYRLRDLRSSNGTFVNGQRITGEVWLKPEDQVRIGPYRFILGEDGFDHYDESRGLRVDVVGLNKWVRKDLNILQNISLVIQPREFVVVVGQSGGGKSTLVDAVAGYRPATHGRVYVNGMDVYRHFDAIRYDIGFVPQRDIIHMELTVFQAMDYAAQLRMPPDTTAAERHQRVNEVLQDLDLAHRKDVQISGLSGGQQKRVSIGVELLTKPGLFFLDEPTSGLDPGTETALMQLMRRLADQGRTIILITHATKNVMLADKVVFLARGGYLAWYGPPDEALQYFDQFREERDRRASAMEFDQIYAILDDPNKGNPAEWAKRFQGHAANRKYILEPLAQQGHSVGADSAAPQQAPAAPVQPRAQPARPRQVSALRQFFVLSARNLRILTRDRSSLILMLAAAPMVGLLDIVLAVLLQRNPFSVGDTGSMPNVMISLFLLGLYGVMVGALAQMREIVKEQDIYKRERLVNLKIIPYVLSKIWVAGLLALYQSAIYVVVHYIAFEMPGGVLEFGLVFITVAAATMTGMMLGLFSSALAPNANSAPILVILLILPQIVLAGALIAMPGSGEYVSAFTTTRWAFESLMSITGVGSDVAGDACWQLPEEQRNDMTLEVKAAVGCRCMGTAVFSDCQYPGVRQSYNSAIDEPEPQQPALPPLRDPPPDPVLPPEPERPSNVQDQVAMAEYQQQIDLWRAEVNRIQANYQAELAAYQVEARDHQERVTQMMTDFQTRHADWHLRRVAAVGTAEATIERVFIDFGWTFVDKRDAVAFWGKITRALTAQAVMSTLLFGAIIVLQKRKDVV